MWVEHPDIQECLFMASPGLPEPFHRDVKSGTIGCIGGSVSQGFTMQSEVGDLVPPRHHAWQITVGQQ